MTISPIQPLRGDYVTKGEFNNFVDTVEDHFDDQKSYMDTGFDKLGEQINAVESNLGNKIDRLGQKTDKRFDEVKLKFDGIDKKFEEQKVYIDDGFCKVFKRIDSTEWRLFNRINDMKADIQLLDIKFDLLTKTVNQIATHLKV